MTAEDRHAGAAFTSNSCYYLPNPMRPAIPLLAAVALAALTTVSAQDKKPPEKIVFPNKQGAVPFLHAKHAERVNGDCSTCHDKLWAQTSAPLKDSLGCHTCHKPDGMAFSARDRANCERCHPAGADKTPKQP